MTWFRTRCVEENWNGGCERSEFKCSTSERNAIFAALRDIENKLNSCSLRGASDVISSLRSKIGTVVFDCETCSLAGKFSDNEITICRGTFSGTQNRMNAVVFHELIHAIGGTELDAEAFENHCYNGQGATAPTSGDFTDFCDNGGDFVNWNPATGSVTLRSSGEALNVTNNNFIHPSGGCGGGDGGWI